MNASQPADITFLLEGTYPYVAGGVSSWVHQIIRGVPEFTFALVFLGSRRADYGERKYTLPDNVVHLEDHYLYDGNEQPQVRPLQGDKTLFQLVEKLHEQFKLEHAGADMNATVGPLANELGHGLKLDDFLYSRRAWNFIRQQFRTYSTDPSFVDYFWSVRTMHRPIWRLAAIRDRLPPTRVFHTVSTGYAGFLGALAKSRYQRPLILSEHGIYTKERKIDLMSAEWIADNRSAFQRDATQTSYLRDLWIRFFEALGRTCYEAADEITALYEVNRQRQIADGADPARTQNIPNGVDISRLSPLRALRPEETPPVLCLIGRVVPIKDVKTFIRAMRIVVNRLPCAEGWVAGPSEEDPGYAAECRDLVRLLGLEERVKFLGFQNVVDLLPRIGLNVLSSISEALPLVLLEGFAAGVPTVCTNVGSCRQLVEGLDEDDRALGHAGRVVGIADPQALADAATALLADRSAWQAAARAGIARVERYYTQSLMFERFRALYGRTMSGGGG